jgi:hypothetical protein
MAYRSGPLLTVTSEPGKGSVFTVQLWTLWFGLTGTVNRKIAARLVNLPFNHRSAWRTIVVSSGPESRAARRQHTDLFQPFYTTKSTGMGVGAVIGSPLISVRMRVSGVAGARPPFRYRCSSAPIGSWSDVAAANPPT